MIVTAGKTNVSVYFYIVQDASNTSPGEPVTGLVFGDIETGGSASFARQGAARTDLTLITLASASAVHADGGFILVDDTNMPGVYRCDYPDAAFATGVDEVALSLVVESSKNAVAAPLKVQVLDVDLRGTLETDVTAILEDTGTTLEARLSDVESSLLIVASDTLAIEVDTSTTLDAVVDTIASDLILLSTKQDSDMVVVATAHTKTQSDIVIVDDFVDTEITALTSNLVIVASDTLAIEVDTSTTLEARLSDVESALVIIASDTLAIEVDTGTTLDNAISDIESALVIVASDTLAIESAVTGAFSELGVAAPTATPTMETAIMMLYMMARNKAVTQTSGTDAVEFYNDAGTKVFIKLLTDSSGDYTEAEMTTGA